MATRAAVRVRPRGARMLPRLAAACLLALLATCLAPTQAAAAAPSRPFLWTVTSPTATVHLLGSIHVATPDIYPLDPRIEAAFQESGTLVLELPLDPATQVQTVARMAEAGTYPSGDSLDLHLDRALLEALQQRLGKSGIPFSTVRSLRPWFVALMLTLGEMRRLGFRQELGVDLHLATRAQGQKRILGLETVDEQVAAFAGMSDTLQEQVLKESLERLDEVGEQLRRALALWRAGDAEGMSALLMGPMRGEFPEMYQRLVAERNRRMTAQIEGYLRGSGLTFVVVGSGHLGGPDGILPLLRARGYQPVQPKR